MNQLSEEQRNRIQILRGVAIIAVVLIHNTPSGVAQVYCRPFINFSVGLFLFLSGMLSSAERWRPKKRIIKVIIPYMIWSLIYVVFDNYKTPAEIPLSYIKSLIIAGAAAIMYYVFVYCEFTLLIPLIDKMAKSKFKLIFFLISPLEIIIMRLLPLINGNEMNQYMRKIIDISCVGWFVYFYLGYLLGNNLFKIRITVPKLIVFWFVSIVLQVLEGYWYFNMGENNCGTQLKLSSIISGILFALVAYKYIFSTKNVFAPRLLHICGDYSFGIFFCHLAVMRVLWLIPHYKEFMFYPLNAIIAIIVSLICVILGRKMLGKKAKYFAL